MSQSAQDCLRVTSATLKGVRPELEQKGRDHVPRGSRLDVPVHDAEGVEVLRALARLYTMAPPIPLRVLG